MRKSLGVLAALLFMGFVSFASAMVLDITIPVDQPICRLYSLLQLFGTVGGVIVAAYSGFQLATSHDTNERNNSKMLISGVVLGLIIIWIAPFLVKNLVGATDVCGW